MTVYSYPFSVDKFTRDQIEALTLIEWSKIFNAILNNRSIEYNIDFTELDSLTRLKEIYDLLETYQLDQNGVYQQVLVQFLCEQFKKQDNAEQAYILVQLVDYIKPAFYYPTLESLITNHSINKDFVAPDGYHLHFHLINAIMFMDTLYTLYPYLISLSDQVFLPEYYQVTLRYIYMLLDQKTFNDFLNLVFFQFANLETRSIILNIFDEYAYYKKSYLMIFNWILKSKDNLRIKHLKEFNLFIDDIEYYLEDQLSENRRWFTFFPLLILVKSFKQDFKMNSEFFLELSMESDLIFKHKNEFFYYLGQMDGIVIDKSGILFSDNVLIEDKNLPYFISFINGYYTKQRPRIRTNSMSILIDEEMAKYR